MKGDENLNLKEVRESKGLTQQQLADEIGKNRSLIAKIENGDTAPSVETAKAISRVLDIKWTIFFEQIGENNSHKLKESEV